jgi:hypothetical protein
MSSPLATLLLTYVAGAITSFIGTALYERNRSQRLGRTTELTRLEHLRHERLSNPPRDVPNLARTLATLRSYSLITRLDVLVNRRLIWCFAILTIEVIVLASSSWPSTWIGIAGYVVGSIASLAFMISAFAMTKRGTAEYRALVQTRSLDDDEITRFRDLMLP